MKQSTGAAVRLHRNAVRDRPESLSAFKWNACPPSPEYPHPGPQRGRKQPEGALTGLGTNFADAARIGVATVGYVSVKQRNRVRGAHRSGDETA